MKKVLITGVNKSTGFETARQLANQGFYVYLGSRDFKKGKEAVEKLNEEGIIGIEAGEINIRQPDSIKRARQIIGSRTEILDVLARQ